MDIDFKHYRPSFSTLWMMVFVLSISAFFSFFALSNARRFHPDEALYMSFSRQAAVDGDWLMIRQPVDKTPLTFYTNALALVFFAIETDADSVLQLDALKGEFAGRMTSVLTSIVFAAVMMKIVQATTDNKFVPLIAGFLVALSPLRIVFAPTAFTDIPMLLFGCLALWMALRGQSFWAGFWLIISIFAKPQIIFYLPLLLGIIFIKYYQHDHFMKLLWQVMYFCIPIIIGVGVLWGWDALRITKGAESFYLLGQANYTLTQLTPLDELPNRLIIWWTTIQYMFGHAWLTFICIGYTFILLFQKRLHHKRKPLIILLCMWSIAFVAIHMLLTLNLFDRNQLVLLPIIIWLFSLASTQYTRFSLIIIVAMLMFSYQAGQWTLPIGGDDGRHDDIHILADYLNEKPVATVIYDRWLDWELDYYIGQWTDKRRVYYPTSQQLVDGALALDEVGTRYFITPTNIDVSGWLIALENEGFTLEVDYQMQNFTVYSMIPPS